MRLPLRYLLSIVVLGWSFKLIACPNIEGWKAYSTDNFVLYTTKDEQSIAPMLYEFEIFRAAVFEELQLNSDKSMLPVEIFYISDPADYSKLGIKAAGYFSDTVYGPRMVIGPEQYKGLSSKSILYHEYLHYVMRTSSSFRYPPWYEEGLAEYYSTLQVRDDHVVVGKATIRKSLNSGSVPAIDQVMRRKSTVEIKSNRSKDEFYASSWLLAHFLSLSSVNDMPNYRGALAEYLAAYNTGVEHDEAFSSSFDVDMSEFKKQLKLYLRKNKLNLARLPLPKVKNDYIVRPLPKSVISLELAYIAGLNSSFGKELLALSIQHENGDALAQQALNSARNNQPNVHQWLEQAASSDSLSAKGMAAIARVYFKLAMLTPASKHDYLEKSKRYFNLALSAGGEPQVHYYFPKVLWQLGEQQAAINHIVISVKNMPANLLVNYQAGKYMLKINNPQYAKYFLTNVVNWSQSPILVLSAQKLLAELSPD